MGPCHQTEISLNYSFSCPKNGSWTNQSGPLPCPRKVSHLTINNLVFLPTTTPLLLLLYMSKSLPLCTASQSYFLSTRLDAAQITNHWIQAIRALNFTLLNFAFWQHITRLNSFIPHYIPLWICIIRFISQITKLEVTELEFGGENSIQEPTSQPISLMSMLYTFI